MAEVYLVILSLTVLFPAICNALANDPECEDGAVVGTNATAFIEFINGYRRKLIDGIQSNGKDQDLLPKPVNLKEVEWGCEIEENAQFDLLVCPCIDLAQGCGHVDYLENYTCVFKNAYWDMYNDIDDGLVSWDELVLPLLQEIDNITKEAFSTEYGRVAIKEETFDDIHNYADWMRADVKKVACAAKYCTIQPNQFGILCCTDQKPMQKGTDYTLYETEKTTSTMLTTPATTTATTASTASSATTAAKTPTVPTGTNCPTAPTTPCLTAPTTPCPTYPPARAKREAKTVNADAFLKRGKFPEATPGENTICPSNKGMTDSLRTLFLDMHNYRRAKLALGKVTGSDRNRMPPAKNMLKLNYACGLEASALRYVSHCPSTSSEASIRPNQGENFLRLAKVGFPSFTDAVNTTVYEWWIVNDTLVIDNTLKLQPRRLRSPLKTFAQMAWAATRYLGCAIADCNSYYVSVCRYSPSGNVVGEMVYKPGHTCTECKLGTTCEEELGLCV